MSFENVEDVYVLSPMQQGMLFHTLYAPNEGAYILQASWEIRGDLHVELFKQAWLEVIERQPILRTGFAWEELEKPLQVVMRSVNVSWVQQDWREFAPTVAQERLEAFLRADRAQPFSLTQAPLLRFALLRLDEKAYHFTWSYHHLLLDGWSVPLVLKDVFTAYEALVAEQTPIWEARRPYRDYIAWLRQQDLSQAEIFWRKELKDFTAPTELRDLSRVVTNSSQARSSGYEAQTLTLSETFMQELRSFARAHQFTLNTLIQGAWALLLSQYSGERDLVYGTVVSGRPEDLQGVEAMIGLFVNTLPVRVQISPEMNMLTWLKELQKAQFELHRYEYSPLMQVQAWSEVPRGRPLFESILAFENYPLVEMEDANPSRLRISPLSTSARTHYPLELIVVPRQLLTLHLSYDSARFAPSTIVRMLAQFQHLLEQIMERGSEPLAVLSALSENERKYLLKRVNGPIQGKSVSSLVKPDLCVHHLVEMQAEQRPDAPAVVFGEEKLTYAELNRLANQLAHYLKQQGVGPEVCVAVYMKRSLDLIVSLLAILKAGGGYIPLDPAYPGERIAYILNEVQAPLVLTSRALAQLLPQTESSILEVESLGEILDRFDTMNIKSQVVAANVANVLYTSGSTGRPKGTVISHRNIVNLAFQPTYVHIGTQDSLLLFSSIAFDVATFEIWGALVNGARLIIAPAEVSSLNELVEVIQRQKISVLWLTAAIFNQVVETHLEGLRGVRQLMVGGEALSVPHVRKALDVLDGCQLINGYGPTENSTFSCTYSLTTDERLEPSVPIGRPLGNTQAYVLNSAMQPVPMGVVGELYLGGAGVTRGYFKQPALVAERYVPDPFSDIEGARLYRTGDLARVREDGTLLFEGRMDTQVKLRGYRIECGEIEACLLEHPSVRSATVTIREDSIRGKQLIAYLVADAHADEVSPEQLRAYLLRWLPDYMLPGTYVWLAHLPLTPNGKVDYRALPDPDFQGSVSAYLAPRTPMEQQLIELWEKLFQRKHIGITDNFFELGGHSILAIRLSGEIQAVFQVQLPLRILFEHPTVMDMALAIVQIQLEQSGDDELERLLAEVEGLPADRDA